MQAGHDTAAHPKRASGNLYGAECEGETGSTTGLDAAASKATGTGWHVNHIASLGCLYFHAGQPVVDYASAKTGGHEGIRKVVPLHALQKGYYYRTVTVRGDVPLSGTYRRKSLAGCAGCCKGILWQQGHDAPCDRRQRKRQSPPMQSSRCSKRGISTALLYRDDDAIWRGGPPQSGEAPPDAQGKAL